MQAHKISNSKLGESNLSVNILLILLDLIEKVSQSAEFDELLDRIGAASKKLMETEASSLMVLDQSGKYLHVVKPTGPVKEEIKNMRIPVDSGYAGWVVRNREPIIANDVQRDNGIFLGELSNKFRTCNLVCVPLFNEDAEIIGVLQAINRKGKVRFDGDEVHVFQALATHSARALQRIQSKQKLDDLLEEQDVLYKEIHHRVKNDFGLIAGIVQMGAFETEDEQARKVLADVQARIKTMAGVHDLLAGGNLESQIIVPSYFKKLIDKILSNFSGGQRSIETDIITDDFQLNPRAALTCGLILNELLMNTYKHGLDEDKSGLVTIGIHENNGLVTMVYQDNGKGLPDDFTIEDQQSLGFNIIMSLVKQMKGTIETENVSGAAFKISFKKVA